MPSLRPTALALAAGAALAAAPLAGVAAAAGTTTVQCRGSERACTATVSLAGGASNRTLVVELPGTSFRQPARSVTPPSVRGAYSLTGGRFRLGGSEWVATLNAVASIPRGARLSLRFTGPAAATPPAARTRSFQLFTYSPGGAFIDVGGPGRGAGDTFTFAGDVYRERNRPPIGRTLVDMTVVQPQSGSAGEVRLYRQVLDLGTAGSIVIAGTNTAIPPDLALVPGSSSLRAVVGGTGDYIGARGQVVTTRIADTDWYRHRFTLLRD